MKLLVLTSEPVTADQLRAALPDQTESAQAEVMVVAPALQESGLRFWMSDADEAIAKAREVSQATVEQLSQEGVMASGDTGESDPVAAIQDALQSFPADRILIFSHGGEEERYREDIDLDEVKARFGVPVERAVLSG